MWSGYDELYVVILQLFGFELEVFSIILVGFEILKHSIC